MQQSVTIIGAVAPDNERESILLVRSLRRNGGFYAEAPVCLVITEGVSQAARDELKRLGVVEKDIHKPNIEQIDTIFMVLLSPQSLILREPIFENLYDHEVSASQKEDDTTFVGHYLKNLIIGQSVPDYFKHINTWFVQATTRSWMWKEWNTKNSLLIDGIKKNEKKIITSEFSRFSRHQGGLLIHAYSCVPNIGMGQLASIGKYEFREPIEIGYQYADEATRICYYGDWDKISKLIKNKNVAKDMKEIKRLLR